ncbi:MAG: acetyl-CoA carboxylase biotin carboxyl carrier protein [Candidatus Methylacidiphilales bacterium]|nr:acetyl-CoA carboxylase biotin carboxyl carrier protein [Candidatus Methylacidiphilales bacterium]
MELKEIKSVIDLMARNGLTEFELERDNFKIRICKGASGAYQVAAPVPMMAPAPLHHLPPAHPAAHPAPPAAPASVGAAIHSPMVGTFYRSPSPDSPSYVEVGTEVTEETVVCIIEAMKVMNEIKAEVKGVITEIVAENGKPVEFGAPLFKIQPR